jgi:hypothetical protein
MARDWVILNYEFLWLSLDKVSDRDCFARASEIASVFGFTSSSIDFGKVALNESSTKDYFIESIGNVSFKFVINLVLFLDQAWFNAAWQGK